ncbi:hypothetical protein [Rosistilla oblonga]|uniref:hypothetical protein n=1 Tax=Rosistilla oblonga TaxID=2527990 RepID=UPI003A97B4B7
MSDLKKLEATIRKGQTAFFAAAKALLEIERRGLWKPNFTSIVEYAAARFGLGGCDVSRYRNAAIVLENLDGIEKPPTNEAQCRELAKLRHQEPQLKVWSAVVGSGEKITAKLIADTAAKLLGGDDGEPKPSEPVSPIEDRTAIHEVATALNFLQAAQERVNTLGEEERSSLLEQLDIAEQHIGELRSSLSAELVSA